MSWETLGNHQMILKPGNRADRPSETLSVVIERYW